MGSNYELLPLDRDKIPQLLEVLKSLLPDSVVAYNWLLTVTRWTDIFRDIKLLLLCPNGDYSDSSMVVLVDKLAVPNRIFGTLYCQEHNLERMKNSLMETKLIEWDRLKHFSAVLKRIVPIVVDIYKEKGLNLKAVPCDLIIMQPERAANVKLPNYPQNVRVGPLNESHLDIVCDNWPHYDFQFRPVVLKMLQLNHSAGVFVTNEKGEEKLASMVLQGEYGGLGLMQTLPKHQRKGYAEIVVTSLTKTLGLKGIMPHGYIVFGNEKGKKLFKKCGFEVIGSVSKMIVVRE